MMFCLVCMIARFINTNASYFNTYTLESEGKSQKEKNKNVIHWPRSVHIIGRNCALSLSTI